MNNKPQSPPTPAEEVRSLRDLLTRIDKNYDKLSEDFHGWKLGNHEDKKGIYIRLNSLERKAMFIPNAEDAELIREAVAYYKAKRELREKISTTLVEKGVTGLVLFTVAAVFFYIKHLLDRGG